MNILLLGSTGMLGKTINAGLNESYNTLCPNRRNLDVTNKETLLNYCRLNKVDAIINCIVEYDSTEPFKMFQINSLLPMTLFEVANELGMSKFINISTLSADNRKENEYFDSYGLSKLLSDKFILNSQSGSAHPYIIRCPQIISADSLDNQFFIKNIIDSLVRGNEIVIYGNNDPYRNIITPNEVCKLVVYLLSSDTVVDKFINALNPKSRKLSEMIDFFAKIIGVPARYSFERSKNDIKNYFIPEMLSCHFKHILCDTDTSIQIELLKYIEK
ncbi:NAD-dependent epimerase/dehydratase family protein [Shewanella litoralis]|uniref:NAD-dependent epimerase/dehydratase domain-containing protein n=1 Tax=Shewanella litoralis TaxID=2282700 RepID=A0ABQ2RKK8_9GAMM|nr:NAD-dependent epimerase/dehydratase family protein [Shewanella litoralis]GGQ33880.1 hypothetical protein GCM10009411_36560 [Shewanella litoralis]